MGKTKRWFNLKHNIKKIGKLVDYDPFFYRHEDKNQRKYHNRKVRHENKIRIKKGWEPIKNTKTRGHETW
jgi:hypothetical protein